MSTLEAGDRVRIVGDHPHSGREGHWTGEVKKPENMIRVEFDDRGGPGIGGPDGCYATAENIEFVERTDLTLEDFRDND
jgi:hypothetical protein